jgi:bacterioferritin-associated ferredoxin
VITDPLLSSLSFAIVHDGAEQHRVGKARALAAWPEALRNLRVCWAGRSADTNCGRCEKCVRTILEFRAAGVPCPPCFPGDVTEDQIRGLAMDGFAAKLILGRILREARATGYGRERWVRMLEERLSRPASRRLQTRAREWLRWSPVAEPARWLCHRWLGR